MSQIEDGGPAFPQVETKDYHGCLPWAVRSEGGMSLRDAFAIAAMPHFFGTGSPDTRAQSAYREADSMLRARKVRS